MTNNNQMGIFKLRCDIECSFCGSGPLLPWPYRDMLTLKCIRCKAVKAKGEVHEEIHNRFHESGTDPNNPSFKQMFFNLKEDRT
jgi:hypothetical protein